MPVVGENFFPRNFCSVKTTHYFLLRLRAVGEIKFGEIFVSVWGCLLQAPACAITYLTPIPVPQVNLLQVHMYCTGIQPSLV